MSADAPSDAAATRDADAPSVTALLPAYNAADFIGETLHSLAAQTYPNFRVLISVDHSDDDTADRCEALARTDARFAVIRQARRLGWVRNASTLLQRADTELCFFMGHDDVVEPEYVASLVAALAANPRAVLAYSDVSLTWPSGHHALRQYPEIDGMTGRLPRVRTALMRTGHGWIPYRGLFRTSAVRQGQPLRPNLAGECGADWSFLMHVVLKGECVRVPLPLYQKRLKVTGLARSWKYGARQRMAVSLCCGTVALQADFTMLERASLLATLARRMVSDIVMRVRVLAGRALRRLRRTPRR